MRVARWSVPAVGVVAVVAVSVRGEQRFPLAVLAAALHIRLGVVGGHQPGQLPEGVADLADRLGVHPVVVQRWQGGADDRPAGLSWQQADRYANAVGLHPSSVWDDWDADAPSREELAGKRCRCKPGERRPLGRICDRCGRTVVAAHDDER